MTRETKDKRAVKSLTLGGVRNCVFEEVALALRCGRQTWREWSRLRSHWSSVWRGHQGSSCRAFGLRGGAALEGGQTVSTEVEHTLMHTQCTHADTRKPSGGRGWCCVGGVLSLSLSAFRRLILKGKHWCVQAGPDEGGSQAERGEEEAKERGGKGQQIMEEEEEEVLCYLDRVLEEEEVFEYEDGELDPIFLTHRQFKVRQRLEGWMQGIHTHTHLCESNTLTMLES